MTKINGSVLNYDKKKQIKGANSGTINKAFCSWNESAMCRIISGGASQ